MSDFDRFTTYELVSMADNASAAAVAHYTRATELVAASASIPYDDDATFEDYRARWRAAMAAGNEQEELCHVIGAELHMRSVCDA